MRKETAVGFAAVLIVAALVYTVLVSRDSIEDFRHGRKVEEVITLRRRSSPGPGLLTVAAPSLKPSPLPLRSKNELFFPEPPMDDDTVPPYSPDSLCGFMNSLWHGSQKEFDLKLSEYLEDVFPRDGSLDFFLAVRRRDWREIEDQSRTSRSEPIRQVGLLSRLNLFGAGEGSAGHDDGSTGRGSLDPRDLDELAEMRARDPGNSFWPIAEAYLKQRENIPVDRDLLIAEAASLPSYSNPITRFYGEIKRTALESGDDRAYMATENFLERSPMLSENFQESLLNDTGRSAEADEMLGWIGKTMEGAQFFGDEPSEDGTRVNGLNGNFMDARMGQLLRKKVEGKPRVPGDGLEMANHFSAMGESNAMIAPLKKGCEDERLHSYFEKLRSHLR
jgi:hypothetical protein